MADKSIPKELESHFINWARDWHGEHDSKSQHSGCAIYQALQKENPVFQDVFNAVVEDDPDWYDSWEQYPPAQVKPAPGNEKKNFYAVTVHIVMEADSEGEASDSMSACLTENLEMSGAILDWGYAAGGNAIDLGPIDKSQYEEGDFISAVEAKAEVAKRYHAFPDMLEALEDAREVMLHFKEAPDWSEEHDAAYIKLRESIASATK